MSLNLKLSARGSFQTVRQVNDENPEVAGCAVYPCVGSVWFGKDGAVSQ